MITNELQKRIHFGDRDAFLAIYEEYGRGAYAAARRALGADPLAKSVVKQSFLTLYEEILTETEDFDIPVRIHELIEREVSLMRLVCGENCVPPEESETNPDFAAAHGMFSTEDAGLLNQPLPPLERERDYRRPRRALFSKNRKGENGRQKRKVVFKALIFLLDLLLIWALAGVLMALGYLPAVDLGYSWFNQSVLPFFAQLF